MLSGCNEMTNTSCVSATATWSSQITRSVPLLVVIPADIPAAVGVDPGQHLCSPVTQQGQGSTTQASSSSSSNSCEDPAAAAAAAAGRSQLTSTTCSSTNKTAAVQANEFDAEKGVQSSRCCRFLLAQSRQQLQRWWQQHGSSGG
jgi:hypothetical protein